MSATQTPALDAVIDSHVHLDFAQFDCDREGVLSRARVRGVRGFVVPGVMAEHWRRVRQIAAVSADIHACYGLHPCFIKRHRREHLDALQGWLGREEVVAVGECGLDFYPPFQASEDEQRDYFQPQLEMAREHTLPVVLHARRSVDAVLKCLRQARVHSGVLHSFSGSEQQAKAAIDQGLFIGVGGTVTYERAKKLRRVLAALPLDALLLETDAPDQPGAALGGGRNEPVCILDTLEVLAQIRAESPREIAAVTTQSARALFALDAVSLRGGLHCRRPVE